MTKPIKVKKIVNRLQRRINNTIAEIVKNEDLSLDEQDHLLSVNAYVVDQRQGRCYYEHKTLTVPLWAYRNKDLSRGFFKHYVAHELAHVLAYYRYGGKVASGHGLKFYDCLKVLAPNTLHFELDYKPRNAAAAGITNKKQYGKVKTNSRTGRSTRKR